MRWSWSAHTTFRRCPRQYLFSQLIASHNARDLRRREAYLRRQLQELPAWRGSLVHSAIQSFVLPSIRAGQPFNLSTVIRQTTALAEGQLAFSRQHAYRDPQMTKAKAGARYAALALHEAGTDLTAEQWGETIEIIKTCLTHLAERRDLLDAIRIARQVQWEQVLQCTLDDVAIVAKIDLWFRARDGQVTIIDWKVSGDDANDYRQQVQLYALVALHRGLVRDLDRLSLQAVNLLTNTATSFAVTEDDLSEMEDRVFRSITSIQNVTDDLDGRTALDVVDTVAPARSIMTCRYCVFRSMCQEASRAHAYTEPLPNQ